MPVSDWLVSLVFMVGPHMGIECMPMPISEDVDLKVKR